MTFVIDEALVPMHLPVRKTLSSGIAVELDWMQPQEREQVRALFNTIVTEGNTYPQTQPLTVEEFNAYWLSRDAFVVRTLEATEIESLGRNATVGAFFIKPNFPGRCSHICNAGFIVHPAMRGRGMGRLMGEAMLRLASHLGYSAVMFNLVFETNIASIRLWESLGFETIGRIPKAAKLADGNVVDALMMYKELVMGSW
jgi:L-amino acid N-acyltransferase YncA